MSNYELYSHQRSDKIKWVIAFTLIIVLIIGVFGSYVHLFGYFDKANEDKPTTEDSTSISSDEGSIRLTSLEAYSTEVNAIGETTVSKKITATVLPVDAPNKAIDWAITWCVPIEGKQVTEYLTVTPDSDGALSATITAHKAFPNATAYVTATTRVGGFTAQCLVTYDGKPETMTLVCNGETYTTTGTLYATAGNQYSMSINLDNTLHSVGSKYKEFEIVSVTGNGKFTLTKQYIVNGSVSSTADVVFDLEQGYYNYTDEVLGESKTLTISPNEFLTATLSGNTLNLNVIKSESSYSTQYPRTGYYFKYKGTYTDPRSGGVPDNCRWEIYLKETVSGKELLLYVDIESTVTSVSLNNTYIAI